MLVIFRMAKYKPPVKKSNNLNKEKELPKICGFCEKAVPIFDENLVLCKKSGIVGINHVCKKFIYDPLKRVPVPPVKIAASDAEDIQL